MNKIALIAFALVAIAAARPDSFESRESYAYRAPSSESSEESYESSEAKYNFQWAVSDESSENHYGHQEARDGDDTQGSYYVQLPDGRLQKVTFHVDGDNGYVANVEYEGEAQYASAESGSFESVEAYRPRYSAPDSSSSEEYG
ncbi:unnamed protein product, partial [Meganyctiphanes norvegica]